MENNKQLWKNMKNTENRFGPHANSDQNRTEAVFIKETRFSSSPNDVMKKWDGWKTKENKKTQCKTIHNCENMKNTEKTIRAKKEASGGIGLLWPADAGYLFMVEVC